MNVSIDVVVAAFADVVVVVDVVVAAFADVVVVVVVAAFADLDASTPATDNKALEKVS